MSFLNSPFAFLSFFLHVAFSSGRRFLRALCTLACFAFCTISGGNKRLLVVAGT